MRRGMLMTMTGLLLAATALAQTAPPAGGPDGRERPGRGQRIDRWILNIADRLQLDEAQRAQFDEILAAHRQRMQEQRPAGPDGNPAGGNVEGTPQNRGEGRPDGPGRGQGFGAAGEGRGAYGESLNQAMGEIEQILRPEQMDSFRQMREEWTQRSAERRKMMEVVRELPDQVNMDDEQRAQFRELIDQRRSEMRDRMSQMQGLWDEMRTAREAGDEARIEELRGEIEAMQPTREQQLSVLLDAVAPLLRDDQKPLLDQYRAGLDIGAGGGAGDGKGADLRALLRLVRRLDLSDEQKRGVKEIEEDVKRKLHDVDRKDSEANALITAEARAAIEKLLTPEQLQRFEAQIERQGARARRDR